MTWDEQSATAAMEHLAAMGAARYEIGVRRMHGAMLLRVLTARAIGGRLAWLGDENARGADIFIRPAGSSGLVLMDDLDVTALARLEGEGLRPAAVVETSPANYQAWVRLSVSPLAPPLATAAARVLAARYDGDLNAATWRHFGRLAGYDNVKRKHRRADGTYPLVLLRATAPGVPPAAEIVLVAARERLVADPAASQQRTRMRAIPVPPLDPGAPLSPLGKLFRREVTRLAQRYPVLDGSRLDWMVVLSLARAFADATAAELAQAMVEGSPHLEERKAGHVADYVARTVGKALDTVRRERAGR